MKGRTETKISVEKHIQEMISKYPRFLKNYYFSINISTHMTKLRYVTNVIRFLDYKYPDGNVKISDLSELTKFDIEEYINDISFYEVGDNIKEMKPATKACIYSSLSSFFEFMVDNNYITVNPMNRIKRPKINQNDIIFLEPEEVKFIEQKILKEGSGNQTARSKQEDWKLRDFLLFHIPVINGIRVEALREININDIHLNKKSIIVTEKGNVTKEIYIDDVAVFYIKRWIRQRERLLNGSSCEALFISNRRERMTVRAIEKIIMKYADGINGKHITPHKLRSTFGTNGYRQTGDIKAVANALGHKSTVPTERYVKAVENSNQMTVNIVANLYR